MLDYIALGMVLDKAQTGYDIKKEIEIGVGNFYKASYGSLYPALKKFADKGYLTVVDQPQGNRVKKFYKATELGKTAFLEWLASPFNRNSSGESLLARIYFFGELPKDTRNRLIKEYESYSRQLLEQLQDFEKQLPDTIPTDKDYFELSTLYFGLQNLHTTLDWFAHIREKKPLKDFIKNTGFAGENKYE